MADNLTPYDQLIQTILENLKGKKLVHVKIGIEKIQRKRKYVLYEFEDGTLLLVPVR